MPSSFAFDTITGGGEVLVNSAAVDASTRVVLKDLDLTNNNAGISNETVTLTIDPTGPPTGDLRLDATGINFILVSGSVTLDDLTVSDTQITFDWTGAGTIRVQNVGVYGNNFGTAGEFFELQRLNLNFNGADFQSDDFVVDTTDYAVKGNFSGTTGGSAGDIFKVGDVLSYTLSPFDFSTRGAFTADLSTLGGSSTFDIATTLTVVEGSVDNATFTMPVTLDYTGINVTNVFTSKSVSVDNQSPSFGDLSAFQFLTIPTGKTVAGVGDTLTLTFPDEVIGSDDIIFTADFSDIAGSVANFVDEPVATKSILTQEVALDQAAYQKLITFQDDAGNATSTYTTNVVSVDLIRPILATSSILSVVEATVPAVIGNNIQIALPVDMVGSVGDTITYTVDLSTVGGASANFDKINTLQTIEVTAGALNDVLFNAPFTVFDKAENTVISTTNDLQIDNQLPSFNTTCGATFGVIDLGDSNGIADLNNGDADQVIFNFPDRTVVGCEFDRFTIDFFPLTNTSVYNLTQHSADGGSITLPVGPGSLDNTQSFPIDIIDINGNVQLLTTGSFLVDNHIINQDLLADTSIAAAFSTADQELHPGIRILGRLRLFHEDIASVIAYLPEASTAGTFQNTDAHAWEATLEVTSGPYTRQFIQLSVEVTDDAGNHIILLGKNYFHITNNTQERRGGGGGSVSLPNLRKEEFVPTFYVGRKQRIPQQNLGGEAEIQGAAATREPASSSYF